MERVHYYLHEMIHLLLVLSGNDFTVFAPTDIAFATATPILQPGTPNAKQLYQGNDPFLFAWWHKWQQNFILFINIKIDSNDRYIQHSQIVDDYFYSHLTLLYTKFKAHGKDSSFWHINLVEWTLLV